MDVYIIACKYGMENLAKLAAEKTLNLPLDSILDCKRPETDDINFTCV